VFFLIAFVLDFVAALPVGLLFTFIAAFIFNSNGGAASGIRTIVNIIGSLLGLYGLLGWIPFLIVLTKSNKS